MALAERVGAGETAALPGVALEKEASGEILHIRKDLLENDQAYQEPSHGEAVTTKPIEIALRLIFAH